MTPANIKYGCHVTKNRKFDKKSNKKILKNPVKDQLLPNFGGNDTFVIPFKNYG